MSPEDTVLVCIECGKELPLPDDLELEDPGVFSIAGVAGTCWECLEGE